MEENLDLFADAGIATGPDWSGTPVARRTNYETAQNWVTQWHYLGKMPASARCYGVFQPDLIAVVMFSQPTNVHGIAGRFDLDDIPGNIEISRVIAHPDAPKNTTSAAVAACCAAYHRDYPDTEWVFSYADTGQGHHGGIYQAVNAIYVGISTVTAGWLLDGDPIHPRSVVQIFGTQARDVAPKLAAERGQVLEFAEGINTDKHTYILPIGSKASRRRIVRRLRDTGHTLDYPKREAS